MPFGDSITEIVCWRSLLWQKLQTAGYKNVSFVGSMTTQAPAGCGSVNYDRHHEGHSGYLAIDIVSKSQLVGWLKNNPADMITMHLGTNDIVQGHSTNDILAAFSTLVQQMRASNPNMKIIVAQIIPISFGSSNTAVTALNQAIPAWAASKNSTASPIWVVDQNTGFSTSDLRDGVHPNDSGDAKMAAKWYPAVVNAIEILQKGAGKREVEFTA
ncbi:carbohydrate esterase family 3 protein [Glonium stellatum]|uniref:Carbohydrate esterase family 3 protein n=1 Tax=Glonium stellatum TaxID=574774 RepID=A0A8E2JLD2_9PEZI|nr:carbohydrate esterase family 3 protein [Glonium stellatum]